MLHIFILFCLCRHVDTDVVNLVSVMEGESATLHINVTDKDSVYMQLWRGPGRIFMIRVFWYNETPDIIYFKNEGFRDRLQIDNQTGSLTIRNIRTTEAGLYKVMSYLPGESLYFNVTVYTRLPNPVIHRDSSQCSSSSGSCSLLRSVVNVSHVTLSWLKGNSLLSSISVSDLISSVSLHLEVEDQNNNTYRCEIRNPVSNQTTHLDINQLCQESIQCCFSFTEAVIQLAISVVVGVATVTIVIYDITSRRASQSFPE